MVRDAGRGGDEGERREKGGGERVRGYEAE